MIEIGGTFLYNVGPITSLDSTNVEPPPVLFGDADRLGASGGRVTAIATVTTAGPAFTQLGANLPVPAVQRRPALDAQLRRARRRRRSRRFPTARRCSPGNAPRASTSTSGRSSTSVRSGRSRARTSSPIAGQRRWRSTRRRISTCTRSRCRSRRPLLTSDGNPPTDPKQPFSVIGVWTHRRRVSVCTSTTATTAGPTRRTSGRGRRCRVSATRCSTRCSCRWSARTTGTRTLPTNDSEYADGVLHPELAKLLPVLYPGAFPNLAGARRVGQAARRPRRDPAHRDPGSASSARTSRTSRARRKPTCCA